MKILSWNCNGKFREKYKYLLPYCADVYIIAECENPAASNDKDYRAFAANGFWNEQTKDKGLGVFAHGKTELNSLHSSYEDKSFLPVIANESVKIVGVWTVPPYTKRFSDYIEHNADNFGGNTVLMGDFNSNQNMAWDKRSSALHKECVEKLETVGMLSMYHRNYGEKQGEESIPTFYMYRHKDKGFHIDHCFARPEYVKKFEVLSSEDWLKYSDHMPLLIEIIDSQK